MEQSSMWNDSVISFVCWLFPSKVFPLGECEELCIFQQGTDLPPGISFLAGNGLSGQFCHTLRRRKSQFSIVYFKIRGKHQNIPNLLVYHRNAPMVNKFCNLEFLNLRKFWLFALLIATYKLALAQSHIHFICIHTGSIRCPSSRELWRFSI